jgi:hypothetical protein
MRQKEQKFVNFWYESNKFFLPVREMIRARILLEPYFTVRNSFFTNYRERSLDSGFKKEFDNINDYFKPLVDNHLGIFSKVFQAGTQTEQIAFELSNQGLLFDNIMGNNDEPRRRRGNKVYTRNDYMRGYFIWHAFVRLIVLLFDRDDTVDTTSWMETNGHLGPAAGYVDALIKDGNELEQPNDPSYSKPRDFASLKKLKTWWSHLSFQAIDEKPVKL